MGGWDKDKDSVTDNIESVDLVDEITEVANVTSVDLIDEITNITSVDAVDEVTQGNIYLWDNKNEQWTKARLDESTSAFVTISYGHHEIHAGTAFFAHVSATKDIGDTISFAITTPDTTKEQHLIVDVRADNNGTFSYISGVTSYSGGNAYTAVNRNPRIGTASVCTLKYGITDSNPLVLTDGTTKYTEIISSNKGVQWDRNSGEEVILPRNSIEVFRVTCAANSMTVSILLNWYEHTPHA